MILVGRREDVLEKAARELGDMAEASVFDITRLNEVPAFIESIESEHGPVDTLINNAGNHLKKKVEKTSDEELSSVLLTHVNASFTLSREISRRMLQRGEGQILFISSMAALFGIDRVAAYSAAKAALLGLTRSLSADLAGRGIRVNCIAPGWIHSDMMHKALEKDAPRKKRILDRTHLGDFGQAEDIGWAAVFLTSPAARFITGTCLPVDGGASIGF